mmetsp:Transcript_8382/g.13102  ORF Transcript_8382/g.13102 Transcript_8382/m.13102 type:complete len:477 (-) Transcript_8382:332-1762(-)
MEAVYSRALLLALLPVALDASRCLSWVESKSSTTARPQTLTINSRAICAMVGGSEQAASCSSEGTCSLQPDPVDVGLVEFEGCKNGNGVEALSRVAEVDEGCGVRWRFLTYDVWPIGSVIVAGKTEDDHNFGICRCPKTDNDVDYHIGRLYLSGPKMGGCECHVEETEVFLIGEYEYLQADEGKGHLFEDVQSNSNAEVKLDDKQIYQTIANLIGKHMHETDRKIHKEITGYEVEELTKELLTQSAEFLRKVLSHERYIPHPTLNIKGLHLLRCVLAERVADARRREKGYHKHPDYETFMRDGILVKNFTQLGEQDIKDIMTMVSGMEYSELPPLRWVDRPVKHMADDAQYEMHVDTFHAAYKIWIYQNATTAEMGPLNFVRGSHRNSPGKLAWLYRVTVPPAKHVLREPSIRLNEDETKLGFKPREIMTTPPMTFVIADTSGFHARGYAEPGTIRNAMRIEGPYDGGLPRKNPFI